MFLSCSRFTIPAITTKEGETIYHPNSNVALGVRRQPIIAPRPLHDPMAEHAIVLYDPTVDLIETPEERAEREKEEADAKKEEEKKRLLGDGPNPHKSLKLILGLDDAKGKDKKSAKVPVVIDPKLAKVLRPHQVEGVKVRSLPLSSSLFRPLVDPLLML
jgi:DNA repair and recombination RAD54-like protein